MGKGIKLESFGNFWIVSLFTLAFVGWKSINLLVEGWGWCGLFAGSPFWF